MASQHRTRLNLSLHAFPSGACNSIRADKSIGANYFWRRCHAEVRSGSRADLCNTGLISRSARALARGEGSAPCRRSRRPDPASPVVLQNGCFLVHRRICRRTAVRALSLLAVQQTRVVAFGREFFFCWSGVLAAFSLASTARLSERSGLANTMMLTHALSSICLILAADRAEPRTNVCTGADTRAHSPKLDVPTSFSYVRAVVMPTERPGPRAHESRPLIICGLLKIIYDFVLFWSPRHIKPPDERRPTCHDVPFIPRRPHTRAELRRSSRLRSLSGHFDV